MNGEISLIQEAENRWKWAEIVLINYSKPEQTVPNVNCSLQISICRDVCLIA